MRQGYSKSLFFIIGAVLLCNGVFAQPSNSVAKDVGTWGGSTRIDRLGFVNQPQLGLWGNFYDDCVGKELFHPQHVVRLPNKDGSAYFVVAQSRAHNGWISILRTDPGQLDPATDQVRGKDGEVVGKYIWQDLYKDNPVGNWNHPGKMDVQGGILVVAAQNWDENNPFCQYAPGSTEDKVLFYNIKDPEAPEYIGAISAAQMGVPEVSVVALVQAPDGTYLLQAGGDGTYSTFAARSISPKLEHWSFLGTRGESFSGQHGINFSSYQQEKSLPGSEQPGGSARMIYFDASPESGVFGFTEWVYDSSARSFKAAGVMRYPIDLPGANRDWDSNSIYITADGVPIVYTMKSKKGENGEMYQAVMGP